MPIRKRLTFTSEQLISAVAEIRQTNKNFKIRTSKTAEMIKLCRRLHVNSTHKNLKRIYNKWQQSKRTDQSNEVPNLEVTNAPLEIELKVHKFPNILETCLHYLGELNQFLQHELIEHNTKINKRKSIMSTGSDLVTAELDFNLDIKSELNETDGY